jgi:hypothetical protein
VGVRTEFPRRVREIEHTWITLAGGTRLAARIWLPEDAEDDPVPAILRPEDAALREFEEPEHSAPLRVESVAAGPGGRSLRRDLATGMVEQVFDWDLGGTQRLVDIDLETSDTSHTVYSIREGDPLSASVRFHASSGMARGDWSMRSDVTSAMTADAEAFHVTTLREVYERAGRIFARSWAHRFPRDHV